MAVYAYIRVSTEGKGQTTDNQRKVIVDGGFAVDEFFSEDGVSGSIKAMDRPAFSSMVAKMVAGDSLIVTMVDRLGRSASDILNVIEHFKQMGVKVRVLQFDGIDITSAMGKMVMTCMAAMAELERNILIERTVAGLERTKAQGTKLGRPLTVEPATLRRAVEMHAERRTIQAISNTVYVPKNTIHRLITEWADNLDGYEAEWEARKQQYANNS